MRGLKDKVVIVTGSTAGIGLAIAERFLEEGSRVVISSRKIDHVDEVVKKLRAKHKKADVLGVACHVGVLEDRKLLIAETVKRWGHIDILVSNVAVNPVRGTLVEATDEKAWDKVMDVNVKASFFLAKECLVHMKPGGAILFISSYAGYVPSETLGAYSISKTALLGLTRVLANDVASRNVRVNCLAPGMIETAFSEAVRKNVAIAEKIAQEIPMKRFGKAEDLAGPAVFLCSADAAYITGETLLVTGGINARL